jgi:uncharacterized protein YndB with AHSA1/START domain
MWFALEPTELDYTDRSPHRIETVATIAAPPERVFDILSDAQRMSSWFHDLVGVRWTTPAPHGVGSTREVQLEALTVKERFLSWEPGRRLSFSIYAMTLPLAHRLVEDIQLEADGAGRTRVQWRVHYTPSLLMRLVHPAVRAIFARMFRTSLQQLARVAEHRS